MLTPCSSKSHFVVIELCDEIRIDTLEVGNFEFFSSRVREVRVRAGESEGEGGDDEEDWKDLGTFKMENVRGMQVSQDRAERLPPGQTPDLIVVST